MSGLCFEALESRVEELAATSSRLGTEIAGAKAPEGRGSDSAIRISVLTFGVFGGCFRFGVPSPFVLAPSFDTLLLIDLRVVFGHRAKGIDLEISILHFGTLLREPMVPTLQSMETAKPVQCLVPDGKTWGGCQNGDQFLQSRQLTVVFGLGNSGDLLVNASSAASCCNSQTPLSECVSWRNILNCSPADDCYSRAQGIIHPGVPNRSGSCRIQSYSVYPFGQKGAWVVGCSRREDEVAKNEVALDTAVELRKKQVAEFQADEKDRLGPVQGAVSGATLQYISTFCLGHLVTPVALLAKFAQHGNVATLEHPPSPPPVGGMLLARTNVGTSRVPTQGRHILATSSKATFPMHLKNLQSKQWSMNTVSPECYLHE